MSLNTLSFEQRMHLKAKLEEIKGQRSPADPKMGKLERLRRILRMKGGASNALDVMYDLNVAGTFKILP